MKGDTRDHVDEIASFGIPGEVSPRHSQLDLNFRNSWLTLTPRRVRTSEEPIMLTRRALPIVRLGRSTLRVF